MTKRAVVVGVNDYSVQGANSLRYCVPDARAMYHMLIDAFGFEPSQVYCYTDATATSENIRRALRYVLVSGEPGDVACFYYSGHGARLPHPTRAGEFYETIIPYSGQWITDHEIFVAAESLQPSVVNFTVILDSCHSGGMHDESEKARSIRSPVFSAELIQQILTTLRTLVPIGICIPPSAITALANNITNVRNGSGGPIDLDEDPNRILVQQAKSTLIAGCKADEFSMEQSTLRHGLLTQSFIDIVNASNFTIDHRTLIDRLIACVRAYMQRFFPGDTQTPQLRGQMNRMEEDFLLGWRDCR